MSETSDQTPIESTAPLFGPSSGVIARNWRRALGLGRRGLLASARFALDLTLPHQCAACRAAVVDAGICPACWAKLSFIAPPFCPRLGIPFAYDPGPGVLSMEAIADPPAFHRARAVARYDEVARTLVHALKYQDRTDLAPVMGRWMARAAAELLAEADVLVPVPLHWRRNWSRRYNQSAELASVIGKQTGLIVEQAALRRIKPTAQQVGLSRSARALNVQGAFRVGDDAIAAVQGRRIVLVDDVLTSGATADACARALLRAGAASVDLAIFARVVGEAQTPIYSG